MTHTPHELADDFPEMADKIRSLTASDAHFSILVDKYHQVNRAVHRAETRIDTVTEEHEEDLRRKRSQLKDHIWMHLREG